MQTSTSSRSRGASERLAPWLSLLLFAAVYAAAFEAVDWVSVYVLDWWEPKFLSREGNIQFGREIMPLFLAASTVSYAFGAARHWRALAITPATRVLAVGAITAVLAVAVLFGFGVATRGTHGGLFVSVCGLGLLISGPAAFAAALFRGCDASAFTAGR